MAKPVIHKALRGPRYEVRPRLCEVLCRDDFAESKRASYRWANVTCKRCLALREQKVIHKSTGGLWDAPGMRSVLCHLGAKPKNQTTHKWANVICKRCLALRERKA